MGDDDWQQSQNDKWWGKQWWKGKWQGEEDWHDKGQGGSRSSWDEQSREEKIAAAVRLAGIRHAIDELGDTGGVIEEAQAGETPPEEEVEGDGLSKRELCAHVKQGQRTDEQFRERWKDYCDNFRDPSRELGVRDPSRHNVAFLREFFRIERDWTEWKAPLPPGPPPPWREKKEGSAPLTAPSSKATPPLPPGEARDDDRKGGAGPLLLRPRKATIESVLANLCPQQCGYVTTWSDKYCCHTCWKSGGQDHGVKCAKKTHPSGGSVEEQRGEEQREGQREEQREG